LVQSGSEPGAGRGTGCRLQPTRSALRLGRLAVINSVTGIFSVLSARQAHDGRPDEQLHFSTLPMNGRSPPQSKIMACFK
jgi:hypothetical protein